MKIVTAPHPSLRRPAKKVKRVDKKLIEIETGLRQTLAAKRNPRGVGLAAPQVNKNYRMFAANLHPEENPTPSPDEITVMINPVITKHADQHTFGPDEDEPTVEGCLSIPHIYGPVPRWQWVTVEYEYLDDDHLSRDSHRFEWFPARIVQHELDHLDGVLFTDYSLEYDLPVYQEDPTTDKLTKMTDRSIIEVF